MINKEEILARLPPWQGTAEDDSFRDFLGVRTRVSYLPPGYQVFAGTVEGWPNDETRVSVAADPMEMFGLLRGVIEAKDRFRCVELGAGWGPFVVAAGTAARRLGISDIKLTAVEAAEGHAVFLRQHMIDNGFDPEEHRIFRAVVGAQDGVARFPRLNNPELEWGGEAIYDETQSGRTPQRSMEFDEVPCLSLSTVLDGQSFVDVVHIDIQGSEFDVVNAGIDVLNAKVGRVVIGTHGRDIEQSLFVLLDRNGWKLEAEKACRFQQTAPHPITLDQDGVQVWRNGAL